MGIKGSKKWNQIFTRKGKGKNEITVEELERLNRSREYVVTSIAAMQNKKATVEEMTKSLYQFLVQSKMQEKVYALEKKFEKENDFSRAREYAQIYRLVIELLDQIVLLLGQEEITLSEYYEILCAGFDEIQVGTIPLNTDQIVIGDIERTRLKATRTVNRHRWMRRES